MYCRSSPSITTRRLPGSPSIHPFSALSSYMHWQIWHDFFNAFLLETYYYNKIAFLKYSWRAYYAPFTVLRYICSCGQRSRSNLPPCKGKPHFVLPSLSHGNSVGGDIVMRSFVCGWVSEWVCACVLLRFALWTRYRLQCLPNQFQTSHISCG